MPVGTIANNENGLSVRNKLNALIAGYNTLSAQSSYRHILNSSGVQLPQREQLEFNGGFTITDDSSDGITNIFVDEPWFNQKWIPTSGTISGHPLTGRIEYATSLGTALGNGNGTSFYIGSGNNSDLNLATIYGRLLLDGNNNLTSIQASNGSNNSNVTVDGTVNITSSNGTDYGTIYIDPLTILIQSKNGTVEIDGGSGSTRSRIIMSNNSAVVRGGTGFAGLQEYVDYSANYNSLSYVNKGYLTTSLGSYLPLAGGAMTGYVTLNADPTNSLHAATKQYVDGLVVGLWDDRGNYNASGNVFPSSGGSGTAGAILKGDIWTVSVAGILGGVNVAPGDTVRALVDSPGSTSSNWALGMHDYGYTPLTNSLTSAYVFVGNSSNVATGVPISGDVSISNTGVVSIGAGKVTNTMLLGAITSSKLVGTDITTVGALSSGSLANGFKILLGSDATGDLYYNGGSGTLARLGAGTNGYLLTSNGAGNAPTWQAAPVSLPSQTGNANKVLKTDGTTASWVYAGFDNVDQENELAIITAQRFLTAN